MVCLGCNGWVLGYVRGFGCAGYVRFGGADFGTCVCGVVLLCCCLLAGCNLVWLGGILVTELISG